MSSCRCPSKQAVPAPTWSPAVAGCAALTWSSRQCGWWPPWCPRSPCRAQRWCTSEPWAIDSCLAVLRLLGWSHQHYRQWRTWTLLHFRQRLKPPAIQLKIGCCCMHFPDIYEELHKSSPKLCLERMPAFSIRCDGKLHQVWVEGWESPPQVTALLPQ